MFRVSAQVVEEVQQPAIHHCRLTPVRIPQIHTKEQRGGDIVLVIDTTIVPPAASTNACAGNVRM
jgi:hypothetical protein